MNISLGELRIRYDNGLDGGRWLDKKDMYKEDENKEC
jgi:hypothetical protein